MQGNNPVTGELSNSKVAAVFASQAVARAAAGKVAAALALGSAQVQVIVPGDAHLERKLEPERQGIWRTIVVAHVKLGIVGFFAALLAFIVVYALGVPFITSSPVAACLVMLFFGTTGGLMLGGLVSLRPDHDRYVEAAREAAQEGGTSVVVHAFSPDQARQAAAFLRAEGGDVTSTL